jgi:hypothetical protein
MTRYLRVVNSTLRKPHVNAGLAAKTAHHWGKDSSSRFVTTSDHASQSPGKRYSHTSGITIVVQS